MNYSENDHTPHGIEVLLRINQLFGAVVLIPVPLKKKRPTFKKWPELTYEQTQTEEYKAMLLEAVQRGGNLGILDGPASGVVDIDIDCDAEVDVFLAFNPRFAETMRTRGANGCRFWLRPIGDYPARRICAKKKVPGHNKVVAEFRGGGGHQSIVWGVHPDSIRYVWLKEAPPIEIRFEDIKWPPDWEMDFSSNGTEPLKDHRASKPALADPIELGSIDAGILTHIKLVCENWAPAISGNRGHDTTLALAVRLREFYPELSASQLVTCLARFYNPRCQPPWTLTELKHKVTDAIKLAKVAKTDSRTQGSDPDSPSEVKATKAKGDNQDKDGHKIEAEETIYEEVDLEHFVDEDQEPVPEFPLDTFPDTFRKPVEEVMRHYRVSALLPATCALVINSVALGRGVVTKSNVRRTYANLYAIIGAMSGSGKTPPFDEFMVPLMEIQMKALKQFNSEQKPRVEAELKLLEREIQILTKHGRDARKFDFGEECRHQKLAELLQRKAELEDKLQFTARLWTEDFTSEALGALLANNKEQMAVLTDDGGLVIYNLLGRYTDGDVKDDILLCKAKTVSPVPIDRVGRGSILLHKPCVSMLVLTQPDLLYRLFCNERLLAGGFLARCLAVDSKMEIQDETEETLPDPDPAIMAGWNIHIESLIKMFRFSDEPYMIPVDPAVRALSREYFNLWAEKARRALSDVCSFAVRWCERAWEISLNLHTGIYGTECFRPISTSTFQNATRISDFFAERQLEVLRRPRLEAENKFKSRLLEIFRERMLRPIRLRQLTHSHGFKKEEALSCVKNHPDIFGIVTVKPPRGSKSSVVFLKSNPPAGVKV